MDLNHRFTVPATIDETWAAFMDLEGIAPCFPGATLGSVDGDDFTGSVKIKLGPIAMMYNGTGRFVERDETAYRAVIEAKGKDKRGNGTAGANVTAQLSEVPDGTAVEVSTDLSITGKPAQFGRGVIQDVSDKLLGQFVDCIAAQLGIDGGKHAAAANGTEGAAPAQPSPGESAAPGSGEPGPTAAASTAKPPPHKPAEINMMATVAPVLIKRYAAPVAGVLVLLWLIRKFLTR